MIELVVFDCDGVLIDSEAIGARVEAAYFTSIGYPIDAVTMVRRFAGRSSVDMNAEIEAALGTPLPQDHDERMRKALGAAFATELRPMPGIHDLLGRLPFKRCVASSSGPERLRLTLGLTDLWIASRPMCSVPPWSQTGSRRRTCSCSPPSAWARGPRLAWSSRTACLASRRPLGPA